MTGITGVNCSARNGQLVGQEEMTGEREVSKQRIKRCMFCLGANTELNTELIKKKT